MSLGKLPGFKGLVSGSQGKRRFKSDLSVDMISPPLADFRHTMHVGRGGDVFGDTSFLSNYGAREPGSPDSSSSSRTTGFFTRTFRHVRRGSALRTRMGSRDLSSPPPEVSPIIKNAVSLPQLNIDPTNGRLERVLFPTSISSADDSYCTYGLQSGFVTLPRFPRFDRHYQDGDVCKVSLPDGEALKLTRSDSLASFTVDLGPSLMTEVLNLIDNPDGLQMSNHSLAAGVGSQSEEEEEDEEEEEENSSLIDTPVQTPAGSSPDPSAGCGLFRRNMNSKGRSHVSNRMEQEEEEQGEEYRRSQRSSDASAESPPTTDTAMEAERFQRAADVLSRHYGGGSFKKTMRTSLSSSGSSTASPAFSKSPQNSCSFSEEEEEIKV